MERRHSELERRKRLAKQRAARTESCQSTKSCQSIKHSQSNADLQIGYFAHNGIQALCEGDACLITGSVEAMKHFIRVARFSGAGVHATTFSEILQGIKLGAAYCFDEQAYGRFLEPGRAAGLTLTDEDFSDPGPTGTHLLIVRLLPR